MTVRLGLLVNVVGLLLVPPLLAQEGTEEVTPGYRLEMFDQLPSSVEATLEARERALTAAASSGAELLSFFDLYRRWKPGQNVRVGFLDGDNSIHKVVEEVAEQISEAANIKFDFGYDAESDSYRRWSTSDVEYSAEIRISFATPKMASLVGLDSVSPDVGSPFEVMGGRPNQSSMVLWYPGLTPIDRGRAKILHEFMHAVGFLHEHQNPVGKCESSFRWYDDPGYVPIADNRGAYLPQEGKSPGMYTYFSGYPNFWDVSTVNKNIRSFTSAASSTAFDTESVMLYRFPEFLYVSHPSPCAPVGNGDRLSAGDTRALLRMYPQELDRVDRTELRRNRAIESLDQSRMSEELLQILKRIHRGDQL